MKKQDTKVTLVKINISRKSRVFWRQLGLLCGIFFAMGLLFLALAAAQYGFCRARNSDVTFEKCFRHMAWDDKKPSKSRK